MVIMNCQSPLFAPICGRFLLISSFIWRIFTKTFYADVLRKYRSKNSLWDQRISLFSQHRSPVHRLLRHSLNRLKIIKSFDLLKLFQNVNLFPWIPGHLRSLGAPILFGLHSLNDFRKTSQEFSNSKQNLMSIGCSTRSINMYA